MSVTELKHFPETLISNGYVIAGKLLTEELGNQLFPKDLKNIRTRQEFNNNRNATQGDKVMVELDGTYTRLANVKGLFTTLYDHQKTAVAGMIDLEQRRIFRLKTDIGDIMKISYNAAVLSEPVGSGKTVMILALILSLPIPRPIADIAIAPLSKYGTETPMVRREWPSVIRPTLIFVGLSVVKQWDVQIKRFTNLKTFVVDHVGQLRTLLKMLQDKTVNHYDIVLVKNSKITVPIKLPNGKELSAKNRGKNPFIYNIISEITEVCWPRVVVDDFDNIHLPSNASVISSLFTWFVSSTRKSNMDIRMQQLTTINRASEILKYMQHPCPYIMANQFMFQFLNIRNNDGYRTDTIHMPAPKYHVAVFKNPDNKFISLLAGIGEEKINQITEMLNGDAISSAAEVAGIASSSVADIFSKILGDKYNAYSFANNLLDFIGFIRFEDDEGRLLPLQQHPDPQNARYGKKQLLEIIKPEYKYHGLNQLLDSTEEEYKKVKEVNGIAVERVKSNILSGDCEVCGLDLKTAENVTINKCCNVVLCGACGMKCQAVGSRSTKLRGRCVKCREEINIKDIIFISNPEKTLEKISEEEIDDAPIIVNKPKNMGPRTKYTGMMDIIRGTPLDEDKRVDMQLPNMMKGGFICPEPKIRKVLIFASFDETLKKVKETLDKEKLDLDGPDTPANRVHYWVLGGTSSEINDTVVAFTNCTHTCALVINSSTHCAGLNLQTATDLVFMHTINDRAVESQVAGRGHRLGRKTPLNVWFMQYDNEYEQLLKTHDCRIMTPQEIDFETKRAESPTHNLVEIENPMASASNAASRYEHNAPDQDEDE